MKKAILNLECAQALLMVGAYRRCPLPVDRGMAGAIAMVDGR